MVSTQSAQDRYVTEITVVVTGHAALGNWSAAAISAEPLTFQSTSRNANHYATESACILLLMQVQYSPVVRQPVVSSVNCATPRRSV